MKRGIIKKLILVSLMAGIGCPLASADTSVDSAANIRTSLEISALETLPACNAASMSFENPALMPFRRDWSVGNILLKYHRDRMHKAFNPMAGRGEGYASIQADAYIRHRNAAIWGEATYRNGTIFDIKWNESGDYDMVFPYVIADAQGGNLRTERYAFSGGYSNFNGCITWGVEGGYSALLSYRRVDPRPKNISGKLHLRGGIGYNVAERYIVSLSLLFNKFRQTTDISFVSELGNSKLYHLTGLGTHYVRFAGNGANVYNDLYRYGLTLNLLPYAAMGTYLSGEFYRETMRHVIVDVNRLPMASLWHNNLRFQAGWKHLGEVLSWGAEAYFDWHCRHGEEAIFGDASSGSYPQIGSLEMFADNQSRFGLNGFVQYVAENCNIWIKPDYFLTHHRQDYISPRRYYLSSDNGFSIRVGGGVNLSRRIYFSGAVTAGYRDNLKNKRQFVFTDTSDTEILKLEEATLSAIESESAQLTTLGANVKLTVAINNKYALGLLSDYTYQNLRGYGPRNITTTSLFFQF